MGELGSATALAPRRISQHSLRLPCLGAARSMKIPAIGDVLADKYAVEAIVGHGGMGVVLAARHLELDERVAIKLIWADEKSQGPDFIARFVREAKLARKIKSEHVV